METSTNGLLTLGEVKRLIGCNRPTIYRALATGLLKFVKVDGKTMIATSAAEKFRDELWRSVRNEARRNG